MTSKKRTYLMKDDQIEYKYELQENADGSNTHILLNNKDGEVLCTLRDDGNGILFPWKETYLNYAQCEYIYVLLGMDLYGKPGGGFKHVKAEF